MSGKGPLLLITFFIQNDTTIQRPQPPSHNECNGNSDDIIWRTIAKHENIVWFLCGAFPTIYYYYDGELDCLLPCGPGGLCMWVRDVPVSSARHVQTPRHNAHDEVFVVVVVFFSLLLLLFKWHGMADIHLILIDILFRKGSEAQRWSNTRPKHTHNKKREK